MQMHSITIWKLSSIMVVFLILNLPFAFATEINLVFGPESRSFPFTGMGFINKVIEVREGRVFLNITPREGYSLRRVLLFPCRDSNPMECIKEEPIEYESYSDTCLNLEDVIRNGRGGILTLAMLNTTSWLGFWDSYEDGAFTDREINALDLETSVAPEGVEELMRDYGMIPINWIYNASFGGRGLYQIEAGRVTDRYGEGLNFTRTRDSEDLLETSDYLFAFPKSGRVYSPFTLYYQPPVECGNYLCELGESQATCCRDCGCHGNQTCSRPGCVPSSDIKLVLDSMEPQPPLECYIQKGECSFQDLLGLGLHIENAPLDFWINDYFFAFGNQSHREMACIPEDTSLDCTLLLPVMNRSKPFQENRVLSLYFSIGYMEAGMVRSEELPLDIGLDIEGTDLAQELGLQSLQDKLKQMQARMDAINRVLEFVRALMMVYQAWQLINYALGITNAKLSAMYLAQSKLCTAQCPGGCCSEAGGLYALSATHAKLAKSFSLRAQVLLWMVIKAQIVMMIINALMAKFVEWQMGKLEDKLKQRIEMINRDTMDVVGDEISAILPLLVWAKGSFSGEYVQSVCDGEDVEVWYDFTPLNCTGGLWLTPEGMTKQRANETGKHMLLSMRADSLFQGRITMEMGVECNSTRYYGPVMDIIPFLNYTASCENISGPLINLISPANGTIQQGGNITLAYSVSHPLMMDSCNIMVNRGLVQSRTGPETGREYEFNLYNLVPGSYTWRVECEDILGTGGSSGDHEFSIGGPS